MACKASQMETALLPLLTQLNTHPIREPSLWHDWHLTPILGGANNLLYRATRGGEDYAVKFTVRDSRNRAGREFAALRALEEAGLNIAPRAVWLDLDHFPHPVVVQTWLDGETLSGPPETDGDWRALIEHFCAIHSLTPTQTTIHIEPATINCARGAAGKQMVAQHLDRLPPEGRSPRMMALLARFEAWTPPEWGTSPVSLCRVDPNWRNFIRLPDQERRSYASVDWENSGWGDPAFEIADLMTHPAYESVPSVRWAWLIEKYAEQRSRTAQDTNAALRIRTYYTVMLMWWVIRWARYLYEIPRGLDERLVPRPANWQEETERKAERFLARVEAHFDSLSVISERKSSRTTF